MKRAVALLCLALTVTGVMPAASRSAGTVEKITGFHSRVTVHGDGSLTVEETIAVIAAGRKIKRGIYRDFPTRYRDRFGNRVTVPFQVLEVLRDGDQESFHTERISNGMRVYIGEKNVLLEPGGYTYRITYHTDRQIGFFDEYDELYWNVTGNDWDFLIEEASVDIQLPPAAVVRDTAAYTGRKGEKGTDFSVTLEGEGRARFTATRALMPKEGLTVALSWPKGVIPEPTGGERRRRFLRDNGSTVAALAGLAVVFFYYLSAWMIVGRDPPRGIIVPQFEPPEGYSPAAVRYIMKMGYSDRALAAAVVNMAVNGYLVIEEEKGQYTLRRTVANQSVLSKGERRIAERLFGSGESIALRQRNHLLIRKAVEALKERLRIDFEALNFRCNKGWIVPGIVLTLLVLAALVITAETKPEAAFMAVWLSGWTVGCYVLFARVIALWRAAFSTRGATAALSALGASFMTLFSLPFLGGEMVGLWQFASATSPQAALVFTAVIAVNVVFVQLMKAPTLHGRRAMDRIEGFKMYLEAAEKDRLDRLNPPGKTPQLFEKYLPYALALDVENAWSEQFAAILSGAGSGGEAAAGTVYRPGWYAGGDGSAFGPQAMAAGLGSSLAGAISSSSTAPGSSSGSGGGGSSGGGGGGGGGGGW